MRRREFITLVGGTAVFWRLAARAQQSAPIIGFLNSASPAAFAHFVAAFRRGLNEIGYVEGQNVAIEYRWAESQFDRLPGMASDLVRRQVAVIAATGSPAAAHAAKAATTSIPIVGFLSGDPVADGLVASLNRPGGNVTGVSMFAAVLGAKRFELLRELVPNSAVVGLLVDPDSPDQSKRQLSGAEAAARAIGQRIAIFNASSEADFDRVFMTLPEQRVGALLVLTSAFFTSHRDKIIALAAQYRIPTMYQWREYTTAGGLASYGDNLADGYRQVGVYAGRILKGEKPANLPVLQPTKFEFVINLKTAKALGLAIPDKLLAIADEVIE
jgi:putative ABC transport system substrate-binding protein